MLPSQTPDSQSVRPRSWLRFSIRALFMAILLVAVFCGGWVSHKRWRQLELERALAEIHERNSGRRGVTIEYLEGSDIVVTKGHPDDVVDVMEAIKLLEKKLVEEKARN